MLCNTSLTPFKPEVPSPWQDTRVLGTCLSVPGLKTQQRTLPLQLIPGSPEVAAAHRQK